MTRRLGVAAAIVVAVLTVVVIGTARAGEDAPALGPGPVIVALRIADSRFEPSRIEVVEGTTVRFEVRNTDPIGHELIVGDASVHTRHERGDEAAHPPVPGEVSLPPLTSGTTTYEFDRVGTVVFACHLPGHLAYGMRGEVVVVDRK